MQNQTIRWLSMISLVCVLLIDCAVPMLAQQPAAAASSSSTVVVPPLVNFSGVLTDVNGKPLTGVAGVTFALYKESQGGAPLWLETQNVYPDKTGHYTVMLGSTSGRGIPAQIFVAGEARWLGVQPQGQEEQPRVMLLSVPYALKAADAATVGGMLPSAFVLAKPGGAQMAPASVSSSRPQTTNAIAGSGTQNYIPLWTDSKGDLGNSVLFQSGANVNVTAGGGLTINGTQDGAGSTLIPNHLFFQDNGEIASHDAAHRIIFDRTNNILELREYGNIVLSPGSKGARTDTVTFPTGGGITLNGTQDGSGSTLIPNQLFFQDNGEIASHDANHRIIFDRASNILELREYGNIVFSPGSSGQRTGTVTISSGKLAVNGGGSFTQPVTFASNQTFPGAASLGANTFTGSQTVNNNVNITANGTALTASGVATGVSGSGATYGVYGSGPNYGLYGVGTGTGGNGVYGSGNYGVTGAGTITGVTGSGLQYGVRGLGTHAGGTGVYGSGPGYGVYSYSTTGTSSNAGVYGELGSIESGTGSIWSNGGAGVWGDGGASNYFGVIATADNANAAYAMNNSADYPPIYAYNQSEFGALFEAKNSSGYYCQFDYFGDLKCTGSKSAVVPVDGGQRKVALYAIESPKNWFEDFGSGQLSNGGAVVRLEAVFAQTVNAAVEYHVFLTANGDCKGLYVSEKTPGSFEVHELGKGTSNVRFDYRIVALRKNYENIRLADSTHDLDAMKMPEKGTAPLQFQNKTIPPVEHRTNNSAHQTKKQ